MPEIQDDYASQSAGLVAPADDWDDLAPSDSVNFTFLPKSIHVNCATSGTFVAVSRSGKAKTFYGNAGSVLPIRPVRINATGLTGGMTFLGLR